MKLIPSCLMIAVLAGSALAQTPAPKAPDTSEMKLYPMPDGVRMARPAVVPCQQDEHGARQLVLRYCALAPDAPWPAAPKPRPKSGIFPLDQS